MAKGKSGADTADASAGLPETGALAAAVSAENAPPVIDPLKENLLASEFTAWKKSAKQDLIDTVAMMNSGQKGKTWVTVFNDLLSAKNGALKNNEQVKGLDCDAVIAAANTAYIALKKTLDSKMPVWQLKTAKEASWKDTIKTLNDEKDKAFQFFISLLPQPD